MDYMEIIHGIVTAATSWLALMDLSASILHAGGFQLEPRPWQRWIHTTGRPLFALLLAVDGLIHIEMVDLGNAAVNIALAAIVVRLSCPICRGDDGGTPRRIFDWLTSRQPVAGVA